MPRPYKRNLEHFMLPVDFARDIRVRFLLRKHGSQALAIYVAVLCAIYTNGYYCTLDDDLVADIADQLAESQDYVRKVIDGATAIGIFDEGLATKEHILTSKSIQENYLRLVERRRGVKVEEYSLLDSTTEAMPTPDAKSQGAVITPPKPSEQQIYDDMRASPLWLESMSRQHHINREEVVARIDEFVLSCRCNDQSHDNVRDAKQHFNNWLRIKIKNDGTDNNTQAAGREQRAAAYAAAIANLAAQDDGRAPAVRHA